MGYQVVALLMASLGMAADLRAGESWLNDTGGSDTHDASPGGSQAALMGSYLPAGIARQPRSRYAYAGENVSLSIVRGGEANWTQWFHNGNPIPGATNDILELADIQPAQAGNYYAVVRGEHSSAASEVARISVFPANPLQLIWSLALESSSNFSDTAYGLASDADNSVYVAGERRFYFGGYFYWTRKYDQSGVQIWNATSALSGFHLKVGSGNTLAAYSVFNDGGFRRVDYDANGTIVATLERHSTNSLETPTIGLDLAKNIYVGGGGRSVLKYSSAGDHLWTVRVAEYINRIAVDEAGNVYQVGRERRWPYPLFVTKYGTDGNLLWHTASRLGSGLAGFIARVDRRGNLYVAASSTCSSCSPGLVYGSIVKFSASGQLLWATRLYDTPRISTLAVDDQNNVYAFATSGYLVGSALKKFSPDGAQLWSAGVSNESINAIIALGDGSVALAGHSLLRYRPLLQDQLPQILSNPQNQTIEPGAQATLTVTVQNPQSTAYQWLSQGVPIAGATDAMFKTSASGAYSVIVTNESGFVLSPTAEVTIPLRLSIERIGTDIPYIRISAVGEFGVAYRLLKNDDLDLNYWDQIEFQSSVEFSLPANDKRQRFFQVGRYDY